MQLPKFLLHILTETDNKTFCPIRIIALVGSLQYLGMNLAHYIQHAVFAPQDFAVGLGALLAGTGGALCLKKDTPIVPPGA
jgi:hypothetical protein